MMSDYAANAAGWRAHEIRVDRSSATIENVLRATGLKGSDCTLFDLITDGNELKSEFALLVGGELLRDGIDWRRTVVDSEQIFVYNWPIEDSSE